MIKILIKVALTILAIFVIGLLATLFQGSGVFLLLVKWSIVIGIFYGIYRVWIS
jgi:hypothetical protein